MMVGMKSHKAMIVIFVTITMFTLARQWIAESWDSMLAMSDFMAGFFLIFGALKVIDLRGFAVTYQGYNLIAKHLIYYAYTVPFIQIALGIAYLFHLYPLTTNSVNFIVMTLDCISVYTILIKKEVIPCACLGTLFKHPLSVFSLLENALMVIMAIFMVLHHY